MNLRNTFLLLALAVTLTVLLLTSALHIFDSRYLKTQRERAGLEAARISAGMLHSRIDMLNRSLEGIAHSQELIPPAGTAPAQWDQTSEQLQKLLPGCLQLRLLPPDLKQPDLSRTPRMGYADLEMVLAAVAGKPRAAIHGYGTADVHLALATQIPAVNGTAGVLLGSFSLAEIEQMLRFAAGDAFGMELRQGELTVAYAGPAGLNQAPPLGQLPIPDTEWTLSYWQAAAPPPSAWISALAAGLAMGLSGLALLLGFRGLSRALKTDQNSILRVTEDLINGKIQSNYPIRLTELAKTVNKIASLKRSSAVESEAVQNPTAFSEMDTETRFTDSQLPDSGFDLAVHSHTPIPAEIFRAYDIRGIAGKTLTLEMTYEIGRAIGSEAQEAGQKQVIIGRDGRLSSEELSDALARGLQDSGRDVIDLGLVPSPLLYFATHHLECRSGVMITGSHNPPEYNGLKVIIDSQTLYGAGIQRLHQRIRQGKLVSGMGNHQTLSPVSDYIGTIMDDIQIGRPMKVVLDCGNGAASRLAPQLLKTLGCEVIELYCEIDGRFPHHQPDPSKPENLAAVIATVRAEKADLGLALDGDGDRLGVVDSEGRIIWPDRVLMLFATDILARHPGGDIIFDVKCSRNLALEIAKHGGRPLMWKSGHSLLKAKLDETGALLAGELSGHIFFGERWFGFDDGLYAAARLLEILSADSRSSAELFAELPDSINTPELSIPLAEGENFKVMEALKASADFTDAKLVDIDGLRVDFADGWGLIRASNTMPVLTLRFEANDKAALHRVQGRFAHWIKQTRPDLALPFK